MSIFHPERGLNSQLTLNVSIGLFYFVFHSCTFFFISRINCPLHSLSVFQYFLFLFIILNIRQHSVHFCI